MAVFDLNVNGHDHSVEGEPSMPLLWALRDLLNLTGTKYGCGIGLCGACTVHMDGEAARSCQIPLSMTQGKKITTIEGLSKSRFSIVQAAWIEEQVPQCGYCQPGQLMSASALLAKNSHPNNQEIDDAMAGNLCRCATYFRIRNAIRRVAQGMHS